MLSLLLPLIKVFMVLVVAIHDADLARREDLTYKSTFITLTIGEEYLGWNGMIEIKVYTAFGFFGAIPIVSPEHGKGGVN